MKTPYIVNYIEEFPLQESARLFYNTITQINYLNKQKNIKAITYSKEQEKSASKKVILGPDTTTCTETAENNDTDYHFLGPETTRRTFTVECNDEENILRAFSPETTTSTRSIENSDSN